MIIVNSTTPGFGKMFSRFLYLFPNELTKSLQKRNRKLGRDTIFAESTDASVFNANIHLALMPSEIETPGGYTLNASQKISLSDLVIVYDKKSQQVNLRDKKSNKQVFVFDLGFQSLKGRSDLYEFMSIFTPRDHHHPAQLTDYIYAHINKQNTLDAIKILPRIIYEDGIILERKSWQIPHDKLPLQNQTETAWEYFLRINLWRKELNIPDEIFVRMKERKTKDKSSHTEYKPQYIAFSNPFLVDLFEKIMQKTTGDIKITEMTPNSNELFPTGERAVVTEFLAEWQTSLEISY